MTEHGTLAAEASAFLAALSERLEPLASGETDPVAEPAPGQAHDRFRCTGCPICAVITYAQADRSELAGQLAQGALLVVNALRGYLEQNRPGKTDTPPPAGSVQRIDIN